MISHTAQVSFDNYSPAGDLAVLAICLVMVILLLTSYVSRTRSLRIFLAIIFQLAAAAIINIIYHALLTLNDPEDGRTLLKIVLGTLSAGTLFMANYYGKMSLRRVTADHEKMVKFYDKAAEQLGRCGQSEHILEALAREELAENGNWCSFQRDNAPELNL